jgi:hypothetical protein
MEIALDPITCTGFRVEAQILSHNLQRYMRGSGLCEALAASPLEQAPGNILIR